MKKITIKEIVFFFINGILQMLFVELTLLVQRVVSRP